MQVTKRQLSEHRCLEMMASELAEHAICGDCWLHPELGQGVIAGNKNNVTIGAPPL